MERLALDREVDGLGGLVDAARLRRRERLSGRLSRHLPESVGFEA